MADMARALLAEGMRSASLWVMSGNAPAIGFYARLGGRVLTRRTVEHKGWDARRDGLWLGPAGDLL